MRWVVRHALGGEAGVVDVDNLEVWIIVTQADEEIVPRWRVEVALLLARHTVWGEKGKYWSVISDLLVTFTVSVESVTVLQEVADLRVSKESEPVTQWLGLTALQAGVLM